MEISRAEQLLDQFVTKEIEFLDYVKAIRVADLLAPGKSYQAKLRFVHNTFAKRDLHNSNRTLYVKKIAVQKHLRSEKKIKQLEAENQILKEKLAQQKMCAHCNSRFLEKCDT